MVKNKTFFILITNIIFVYQTFAPWNEDWQYIPADGTIHDCANWIMNSGFIAPTMEANKNLAAQRDRRFDNRVSIFALAYAHILIAFPRLVVIDNYTPLQYCIEHRIENDIFPFESLLSNQQKTCDEWVSLYSYHAGIKFTAERRQNREVEDLRDTSEDGTISLWAAGYARFSFINKYTISTLGYCNQMVPQDKRMIFMTLNETKMSCKDWIELSGYNDYIKTNLKKARRLDPIFYSSINSWTKYYIDYLRDYNRCFKKVPCCNSGNLNPGEFCDQILKKPIGTRLKYFDDSDNE